MIRSSLLIIAALMAPLSARAVAADAKRVEAVPDQIRLQH
jgi:hypothetical protein